MDRGKHKEIDFSEVFLTPVQAAKLLNISLSTLKKFIYLGKIKTIKTPGGHHRIRKEDLFTSLQAQDLPLIPQDLLDDKNSSLADSLISLLEARYNFSKGHAKRVSKDSLELAKVLGLSDDELQEIKISAYLHDVGLLGITGNILNKVSPLTNIEYSVIRTHSLIGEEITSHIKQFHDLSKIIRSHHEFFNGRGYPDGLKGDKIPMQSKIIAVCESFDSMTSQNSYKKILSPKEALSLIEKNSGSQFDPDLARVFIKLKKGML